MWTLIDNTGYKISEYGEILNPNGILLKPQLRGSGYFFIRIKGKNYNVHRLVAKYFINNPYNLEQVNHKDGNKQNNKFDNLEWCTRSYNQKHAYANNLQKAIRGKDNYNSKSVFMFSLKGIFEKEFYSLKDAADYCNCNNINSYTNISSCCNGTLKTAYNHKWSWEI